MSVVIQSMHNPKEDHLQVANQILHFLKTNLGNGVLFEKGEGLILEIYIDAEYVCVSYCG